MLLCKNHHSWLLPAPHPCFGHVLLFGFDSATETSIVTALHAQGFAVASETDMQQTVEFFQASYPEIDLVILDLTSGQADPEWVLSRMKSIHGGIRAIALCGDDRFLRRDLIAHGVWCFLTPPLDVAAMLHQVDQCIPSGTNWASLGIGEA